MNIMHPNPWLHAAKAQWKIFLWETFKDFTLREIKIVPFLAEVAQTKDFAFINLT